ncbi:MAG TPA: hypothetical protein VGG74_02020 [Kofleriaceae bacterium]
MTRSLLLLAALAGSAIAGPRGRAPAPPPPPPAAAPEPPAPPMPAEGDPRMIIGILDVRVDGAPPEVGGQFQKDLDAQVDPKHYFIASRARIHELMGSSTRWTEGCLVGPCVQELRKQTRAAVVLVASLTGSGTSFGWVITLVRTDSGNVLSQRAERCDVCTVDEALHNATRAALDLFSAIPKVLPDEHPKVLPAQAIEPLEAQAAALHHARNVTGLGMLVGGLVVAAAGTAVYYADHHTSAGLGVAGAGAGLVVGSIVTFTF